MPGSGNSTKVAGAILAAVIIIGGLIAITWYNAAQRAEQKADFHADVIAMGFPVQGQPSWDDEVVKTGKTRTTKSVLELEVRVGACKVELEQVEGEERSDTINGRKINYYRVDELPGRVDDVRDNTPGALTPAAIEQFLLEYYGEYGCV
jgi:hypothetical protein